MMTFSYNEGNGSMDYMEVYSINATSNVSSHDKFYFYADEQIAFLWILFSVIVVGNSLIIVALIPTMKRKSRVNFFVMHLAVADLLVGLISVMMDIGWRLTVQWEGGYLGCKVFRFLQVLVTHSSTYILVALSIDRYDAITHPLNFRHCWRRARILIGLAWTFSFIFSLPMLYLSSLRYFEDNGLWQCWMDLGSQSNWQIYMVLVTLAIFVLPTSIITGCYVVIIFTIWKKNNGVDNSGMQLQRRNRRGFQTSGEEMDSRRASSRGVLPKAKVKTIKMTFVIVLVFILFWAPYIVYDLLQVFGYIKMDSQAAYAVATFIQSLAPLNSAANPFIYCYFSNTILKNLMQLPGIRVIVRLCKCDNYSHDGRTSSGFNRSTQFSSVMRTNSTVTRNSEMGSTRLRSYIRKKCADSNNEVNATVTTIKMLRSCSDLQRVQFGVKAPSP